ncbi:MAG TPA: hypothetical protein PLX97_13900 [Gemmatales bacterium]|nr:hypothetical protein [Gemmatales bacterium]
MSLKDIERAITQLPASELTELANWFQDYLDDEWDRELEQDVKSGKLDSMLRQAQTELDAGRVTPL